MKLILFLLRCSSGVRYSRTIIALVALTGVIGGAGSTALLAIINSALTSRHHASGSLVWGFVAVCLVNSLGRIVSQVLLLRLTTGVLFKLRLQICRRILSVPLRELEKTGPHRLLATLTDDIPMISGTLSGLPILCTQFTVLICSIAYLLWLSGTIFLVIIAFLAMGITIYQIAVRRALYHNRQARAHLDTLLKHFRGLIEGTKELKLHRRRREEFITGHLEVTSDSLRQRQISAATIYIYANYWSQILAFVIIGLLVFLLPTLMTIDLPILTGYTLVFCYMLGPLQTLLTSLPGLSQASVAVGRVEELGLSLASSSNEPLAPAPEDQQSLDWTSLELVGVTHTYHRERQNSNFMLGPIDFVLHPRELVFVTGANGSGKTTLVKLIAGLYIPEAGEVRLNGQLVTDENRDDYRQHFSVVFSDFYLFESLLGLSKPELDARARDYLTRLQLDHKVEVKGGVLSTTALSQGQRKRLALLTAYLEDRSLYVFDEWAADQDPLFREIFYYQLLPELKARGKTVIVISHDDRYYSVADRIVKLDYGQLGSDLVENHEYKLSSTPLLSLQQG